jgi:hypothetical protein
VWATWSIAGTVLLIRSAGDLGPHDELEVGRNDTVVSTLAMLTRSSGGWQRRH